MRNDESTNQRLRPCFREDKNVKIAKICDPWKFNPAKVKAYTVCSSFSHFCIHIVCLNWFMRSEGEVLSRRGLWELLGCVDDSGAVYVAHYGNSRVQVFWLISLWTELFTCSTLKHKSLATLCQHVLVILNALMWYSLIFNEYILVLVFLTEFPVMIAKRGTAPNCIIVVDVRLMTAWHAINGWITY